MNFTTLDSEHLINLAVRISARYPRADDFIETAANFSAKYKGRAGKRPTRRLLSNLHTEALAAAEHDGQAEFSIYVGAVKTHKTERLAATKHLKKLRVCVTELATSFPKTSFSQPVALVEALGLHMKRQRPLASLRSTV